MGRAVRGTATHCPQHAAPHEIRSPRQPEATRGCPTCVSVCLSSDSRTNRYDNMKYMKLSIQSDDSSASLGSSHSPLRLRVIADRAALLGAGTSLSETLANLDY